VKPVKGPTPEPKLPDIPPTEEEDTARSKDAAPRSPAGPPTVDDFEALRKRFDALKKR
jgi:vacuolar protein sorting-associated protein IST1